MFFCETGVVDSLGWISCGEKGEQEGGPMIEMVCAL